MMETIFYKAGICMVVLVITFWVSGCTDRIPGQKSRYYNDGNGYKYTRKF